MPRAGRVSIKFKANNAVEYLNAVKLEINKTAHFKQIFKKGLVKFKENIRKGKTAEENFGRQKNFTRYAKSYVEWRSWYQREGHPTHRNFTLKKANLTLTGFLTNAWQIEQTRTAFTYYIPKSEPEYKLARIHERGNVHLPRRAMRMSGNFYQKWIGRKVVAKQRQVIKRKFGLTV